MPKREETQMSICVVRRHRVERHAHRAITKRLRHAAPDAVLSVDRDPDRADAVVLHVNCGGSALACKSILTRAGHRCKDIPSEPGQYGPLLRILPTG
ncbi:hypothetical protein [Streptomyces sp. NPDC001508]|uniref:hypothetical protein n=1 Tax=Streptomyces sp. NPDC001508 TaxID=3154656 RepID=UPI0033177A2F